MRTPVFRSTVSPSLACALSFVGMVVAIASCREVVAGDATNFPEALCDILRDCEGDCPVELTARIEDADAQVRGDLLAFDVSNDCLGTCSGARKCRDQPPICRGPSSACEQASDCCGYTVGAATCGGEGSEGTCCLTLGARCDVTAASDAGCCNGEVCAVNGRCGGFECTLTIDEVSDPAQAACESAYDCCSRRCEGGSCVANACSQLGQPCQVDLDCCSSLAADGALVQPKCDASAGVCVDSTEECDVCLPVDDPSNNCCLASGQSCYVLGDGSTQCGSPTCAPLGGDCASNDDCCQTGQAPTYCNTTLFPRCDSAPTCGIVGDPCTQDTDCCTGSCLGDECIVPGGCEPVADHSPCDVGGPLAKSQDSSVAAVCLQQPACCCQEWGATCRASYRLNNAGACPLL